MARLDKELKISSEAENNTVKIDFKKSEVSGLSMKLVGKVFSNRVVNRETLPAEFPRILKTKRRIDVEIADDNLFVVDFLSAEDRCHVLNDGPWHFHDSLMTFKAPGCRILQMFNSKTSQLGFSYTIYLLLV